MDKVEVFNFFFEWRDQFPHIPKNRFQTKGNEEVYEVKDTTEDCVIRVVMTSFIHNLILERY
ncbi:hypothetical protein F2Q68_00035330 [Brassica cretica]|uniref:Uncharacterized protein n=1 Tax=Brassica cretica TaxID=69181 RepID=A0A8S9H651_BRACR|nr:hypothetical protein F2Q68_00035330 [Brassica cretica]